jgi:HEAT repeat protein
LGRLQDSKAVDPLLPLLKDKKKIVRKTAAWALGNIADDRAVPFLKETLLDADADVREAAQTALDSMQKISMKRSADSPDN